MKLMKRYKMVGYEVAPGAFGAVIVESEDGEFVLLIDAMAEIEALRAENDRLKKALKSAIC